MLKLFYFILGIKCIFELRLGEPTGVVFMFVFVLLKLADLESIGVRSVGSDRCIKYEQIK